MATLLEIYQGLSGTINGLTGTLVSLDEKITDLEESRTSLIDDIITPSSNTMVTIQTDKTAALIAADPNANGSLGFYLTEYNLVFGANYWSGQESGAYNIQDWDINSRTRVLSSDPYGSWASFYDYSNAITDTEQVDVLSANANYEYGWDYIVQDPVNQDGTYGLNSNISAIEIGITMLNNDLVKAYESEMILSGII